MDYEMLINFAPDCTEQITYIEDQFGKRVNTRTIASTSVGATVVFSHIWIETYNLQEVMGGYSLSDITKEVILHA